MINICGLLDTRVIYMRILIDSSSRLQHINYEKACNLRNVKKKKTKSPIEMLMRNIISASTAEAKQTH